ncbi:MAG TPA: LysR family transcriptional regulator [Polyangiales bacterium]|nr:LysR family transcriptional regulator [Polyangiales bacterium]
MNARRFEWSDLEIFLAVARGATLAAAGEALRVDASTVQRRIGKLEAGLRTRLFDRSQRGYSLTAAGEELFAHVLAMEEQSIALQRKVIARDDSLQGSVRVATVDDLAIAVLSPILRDYRKLHPKVSIEVDIRTSFMDLTRHQADVALRFGAKPLDRDIIAKPISRVGIALYASRSYLKEHGRPMCLEDLREHTIVRGDVQVSGFAIEKVFDRYADPSRLAFRSNSFLARLAAIREGMGIGWLGCYMGEREKSLERLPLRFADAARQLWLLVHHDLRRNARVRSFVQHVHDALVAQRTSFEGPG